MSHYMIPAPMVTKAMHPPPHPPVACVTLVLWSRKRPRDRVVCSTLITISSFSLWLFVIPVKMHLFLVKKYEVEYTFRTLECLQVEKSEHRKGGRLGKVVGRGKWTGRVKGDRVMEED